MLCTMLRFLCERLSITHYKTQKCSSVMRFLCTATGSCTSNGDMNFINQKASFSLNDLIRPCSLSKEFLSRAKSSEKPNLVINFLQSSGFSRTHIEAIVLKCPNILFSCLQKNLKPKICFFRSLGMSELDVANLISRCPYVLTWSLKNSLMPSYDLIRTLLGEKGAVSAVKSFTYICRRDCLNLLGSNLSSLRNNGVPESQISRSAKRLSFLKTMARIEHSKFNKLVTHVIGMGFSPHGSSFDFAVIAMQDESYWQQKQRIYESFGFSKKEFLSMFRKEPRTMCYSEKSIRKILEFVDKKLHWSPSQFSVRPGIMCYSLEKRITPRCSVLQVLVSRKLIRKRICITSLLVMAEKDFFNKFVNEYMDKIPEVLDAYQGKLEFEEYNFDSGKTKVALTS